MLSLLDRFLGALGRLRCSHLDAYPTNWRSVGDHVGDGTLVQVSSATWRCPTCGHRWEEKRSQAFPDDGTGGEEWNA